MTTIDQPQPPQGAGASNSVSSLAAAAASTASKMPLVRHWVCSDQTWINGWINGAPFKIGEFYGVLWSSIGSQEF